MNFQEYPKCLYRGGKLDAEHVVVFSAEEEEAAGDFSPLDSADEEVEAPKRKPGRPKKS